MRSCLHNAYGSITLQPAVGHEEGGRGAVPRPSGYLCRILVRVPPLPYLGLERLAQRGVRLSRDDKVEILVDGQLAHAVVREALGREYEDPGQVHHDPVTGLPEPEVHAVFGLGRAVEVARVRETVHEGAVRGEHHGRPFPGGREAPGARLRRFAEDPDEQPLLIPEGELLVLGTRRVGPAAREQGVGLVGPRFVEGKVTNDVVAGLLALRIRGRGGVSVPGSTSFFGAADAVPAHIAATTIASTHTIRVRRKVTFMFLSLVLSSFAFVVWAWSCEAYLMWEP